MPLNLITVFCWYYLRCLKSIPHQMIGDVICLTEKLIMVQKMEFSCFQWFLKIFEVLRGVSNTYRPVPGPKWHHGNGIFFTRLFLCKDLELTAFYYCNDLCRKGPWPELLAWECWFFKVKSNGEPAGRKDQFHKTVPSYVYCLNLFY